MRQGPTDGPSVCCTLWTDQTCPRALPLLSSLCRGRGRHWQPCRSSGLHPHMACAACMIERMVVQWWAWRPSTIGHAWPSGRHSWHDCAQAGVMYGRHSPSQICNASSAWPQLLRAVFRRGCSVVHRIASNRSHCVWVPPTHLQWMGWGATQYCVPARCASPAVQPTHATWTALP